MALKLMYITNNPEVAVIAEKYGVDRVWVDLETKGKEQRQKNMNTVKSKHTISDIAVLADVLKDAELMVRINPWDEESAEEIEAVIAAGATRIMLPMWKTTNEVNAFFEDGQQKGGNKSFAGNKRSGRMFGSSIGESCG